MNHTPLPWKRVNIGILFLDYRIMSGGNEVCSISRQESFNKETGNADFIVKACNHHDELVEMVSEFIDEFWGTEASTESGRVIEKAKALLERVN